MWSNPTLVKKLPTDEMLAQIFYQPEVLKITSKDLQNKQLYFNNYILRKSEQHMLAKLYVYA